MKKKLYMRSAKLREVIAAIGGKLVNGKVDVEIIGVSTDTRTTQPGDLFFALIGENSDGHHYVSAAFEKGAAAVIVSQPVETDGTIIQVPDTLVALGDLAKWHRQRFDIRVVGITGSVGKTITKEMVAAVLSSQFKILKNAGNFNNEIGAPLTIFQLEPDHDILVQEMAMRLPGEVARLADIAKPDIGVVTNIGISHIERLGSQDAIAAAKAELIGALPDDGIAVLNRDDKYFDFLSGKAGSNVVSYGSTGGDIRAESVEIDSEGRPSFTLVIGGSSRQVNLPVVGAHNVSNALAAAAVGLCFGLSLDEIANALQGLQAADKRANVFIASGGYKIFDDTYNASPASMIAAIKTLASMGGSRKIAVLGDMKELGDHTESGHREVGEAIAKSDVAILFTVGELAWDIAVGARDVGFTGVIRGFDTSNNAAEALKAEVRAGDVILAKGSRAMKMENVVEALK
jgi:UDP-N-acetylmuramoyl-tripeptide--D-alanyl-D-alanine ligase